MNAYSKTATLIVNGTADVFVGKVYGVATALTDGTMTYDPTANNGKGRLKGGKALYDLVVAENMDVPSEYEGQISKCAKGLIMFGADVVGITDDDDRLMAVRSFCAQWKSLNALSEALYGPTGPKARTLSAIVASMLAECEKNGYGAEEIAAEVSAQLV